MLIAYYQSITVNNPMTKKSFAGLIGSKAREQATKPELTVDLKALGVQEAPAPQVQPFERKGGGTKPIQKNRIGKYQVSAFFEKNAKKQFDMLSVEVEKNKTELLTEAINDLFRKYNKPPIA